MNPGATAQLNWSTTGTTSLSINGTSGAASGTRNVAPTTTTTYTLNASNSFGTSTATVKVNVNAGSAALGVPTISAPAAGDVINSGGIGFGWSSVGGATGYDSAYWDASSGAVVFSGSLSGAAATSTLIMLTNGSYLFGVRACQGNGFADNQCGRFASRNLPVSIGAPTAAPSVTAPGAGTTLTQSIVTLQWTGVTGSGPLPLFYEVELTETGSNQRELSILLPDTSLNTVARVHSGAYSLRVRACQGGCGPWSATRTFSATIAPAPTTAPTITSAVVTGGNSLLAVNWTAIGGAEWYQLYVIQPPPAGQAAARSPSRRARSSARASRGCRCRRAPPACSSRRVPATAAGRSARRVRSRPPARTRAPRNWASRSAARW